MSAEADTAPNRLYALAHEDLQAGRWDECLTRLALLARASGPHPAVLHMRALALQSSGRGAEALDCFEAALALPGHPPDPYLFANAARLSETLGHGERALALHEAACRAGPGLLDIKLARIGSVRRLLGDGAASALYDEWLAAWPDWAELHHHRTLFLRDCGEGARAIEAIDRAIALRPGSASARQLRARIKLDLGQADPAEFEAVIALNRDDEAAYMGAAAAHVQQGQPGKALALLDDALACHPSWSQALQTRLGIAVQLVSLDDALNWLQGFAAAHPASAQARTALARLVWRERGAGGGLAALGRIGTGPRDSVGDRLLRAELLSEAGELAEANRIFAELEPEFGALGPAAQMVRVLHLFRTGDVAQGTEVAHRIAAANHLIDAWAHVELGWRILDDPRRDWLLGSGALVVYRALERFDEYAEPLIELLRALHAPLRHHASEQSARLGTQTDGPLFSLGHGAIQDLVGDIRSNVAAYLAAMPDLGPGHPLTPLRMRNFRFSGSWSIRLTGAGFHTPHFHNEGLLSSACYVCLPNSMASALGGGDRDGWLELGRPPQALGLGLEPSQMIEPKVGTLALFPAFLFHGTRPFGEGERMTAAFDVATILD